MKTLLLSALLLATAISALAQGQLIFANSTASTITNAITGLPADNATRVGLYVGNVGDPVSSLSLIGATTNCFGPGRFLGGTRTLAGWTGLVQIQVRAWLASTVYASYEAAFAAALGGDASVVIGVACPQFIVLSEAPTAPPVIALGMTPIILGAADSGVVCPVPEPSSVALGVVGLGALFLFRRKK